MQQNLPDLARDIDEKAASDILDIMKGDVSRAHGVAPNAVIILEAQKHSKTIWKDC